MRSIPALVCFTLLAGCNPHPGPIPPDELISRVAETVCEGDQPCLTIWQQEDDRIQLGRAADAHRILYDDGAAGKCVEELENADCATWAALDRRWPWEMPWLESCARSVVPVQWAGEDCWSPVECVSARCAIPDAGGEGYCIVPEWEGQPCGAQLDCDVGLYCDAGARCARQILDGEACTIADECYGGACTGGLCSRISRTACQ